MILLIITEMVNQAAKEIGVPMNNKNVKAVLDDLEYCYGIIINEDAPITWQLMTNINESIFEWQTNMKRNQLTRA